MFHLGDVESPVPNNHISAYMANKAGWARGAGAVDCDDSDWRELDVPHDWAVEGAFSPEHHVDAGFLPRGVGWYRRHFRLEPRDRGRRLSLQFDGVATHCTVYVNGHLLHRNFCGYTPFTVDFTDVARFGDELNVVAVRVDATYMEGWWYEGAGIYRHVYLVKTSPVHIAQYGVFVRPEKGAGGEWATHVETTVVNESDQAATVTCSSQILGRAGDVIASDATPITVPRRSSQVVQQTIPVIRPDLWGLDSRALYMLQSELRAGDTPVDGTSTTFGYRTIRFDAERGFFLNDEHVLLKGTCNHQDHAGVGVAVPDSIHEFRVRRLLEMGSNAYRAAHNPPAAELLDACDRLGMLVMDENRNFGSSPEHFRQLRAMVLRDRNHPSVICWSICNEEAIQGTPVAARIGRAMAAEVRRLDPSRPVMAAVSGGILNDDSLADATAAGLDVVGINYQLHVHDPYHAKHPATPLLAAETHCLLGTRGQYATEPDRHAFAAYDVEHAPWGLTARSTWRSVLDHPYLAGLFIWAGFDYRGEPSPHAWPCVNSFFGLLDTCGFAKDAFYLHKAYFTSAPFVHLLPHWNGSEGGDQPVRVVAYTNCPAAELFLNGRSLGRKTVDPIEMAEWLVPFEPGVLRVVAYRDGRVAADVERVTTGPPNALGLEVHPAAVALPIPADGRFTLPVTVFAMDEASRRVPTASDLVTFSVDGPATILGVGNGDPTSHEPDKADHRSLFHGLAQVLLQMRATAGRMTLSATAPGLRPATLQLTSTTVPLSPTMPRARPRHIVTGWRMSPITPGRPDVHQSASTTDVNTWDRVEPAAGGQPAWAHASGYAVYRAAVAVPKSMRSTGGVVRFHGVVGEVELFIDGDRALPGAKDASSAVAFSFPARAEQITLSLLVHSATARGGITGPVELTPA